MNKKQQQRQGAQNVRCARCGHITSSASGGSAGVGGVGGGPSSTSSSSSAAAEQQQDMAQLVCSSPNCRVVLMYPRGAARVQCSICGTMNCAIAVRFFSSVFFRFFFSFRFVSFFFHSHFFPPNKKKTKYRQTRSATSSVPGAISPSCTRTGRSR